MAHRIVPKSWGGPLWWVDSQLYDFDPQPTGDTLPLESPGQDQMVTPSPGVASTLVDSTPALNVQTKKRKRWPHLSPRYPVYQTVTSDGRKIRAQLID